MSEEKSIEEFEAEYVEELNKKTARTKAERETFEAAETERKKEEYEADLKKTWEEEYLIANPPPTKVPPAGEAVVGGKPVEVGKHIMEFKELVGKEDFVAYENFDTGKTFNFTTSDDGCDTDVSAWSPDDVYVKAVWHAMYCEANLFRVCVKGLDIDKGDGLTVQIKTIGKFGAPTEAASCECISCASNTLSTHSLTLKQYGMVTEICEKDIWDVGEQYRKEYLAALGKRWGQFFDAQIYSELQTAAAGTSVDMAATLVCSPSISGSCCTDASLLNFYNAVNEVVYTMQEGTAPYDPDYMIVSPSVAAILKRMQTPSVQPWAERIVKVSDAGKLIMFNGLKVIEYCGAQACSTATDTVFAVILDSRRAVGAAFGKRPSLESDRNIDCNSTTYAMWCFFACGELDVNAIAHIKSPDA